MTIWGDRGDPMPLVSVTLAAEALAEPNAAIAGGESGFAIGAAVTTLPARGRQTIRAQSEDDDGTLARLILQRQPQIPLPARLPLLAAAVGAAGVVLHRRSA